MKNIYLLSITFLLISCSKNNESKSDFIDKTLDIVIDYSNGESLEFPTLYKDLTTKIPDDKDEKLKLAQRLKLKGFKVINWGRGNNPPVGPRIINITLRKEDCQCEVTKIYYSTVSEFEYQMTEKITCKKIKLLPENYTSIRTKPQYKKP